MGILSLESMKSTLRTEAPKAARAVAVLYVVISRYGRVSSRKLLYTMAVLHGPVRGFPEIGAIANGQSTLRRSAVEPIPRLRLRSPRVSCVVNRG